MSILALHTDKISIFSGDQQRRVIMYLSKLRRANSYLRDTLTEMLGMITVGDPQSKLDIFEEALRRSVSELDDPKIFITNEGEDFCLRVDLEEGRDFTGYILTMRNAEDGTLVSDDEIAGSSEDVQEITATSLSLTAGTFYKVNALVEHPAGTAASGNAAIKLTDIILIVEGSIDVA